MNKAEKKKEKKKRLGPHVALTSPPEAYTVHWAIRGAELITVHIGAHRVDASLGRG